MNADEIKEKFIIAYNQLLGNRKELLEACEIMCEAVSDCSALNKEIDALNDEIQLIAEMVNQCVKENAAQSSRSQAMIKNTIPLSEGMKKPTNGLLR